MISIFPTKSPEFFPSMMYSLGLRFLTIPVHNLNVSFAIFKEERKPGKENILQQEVYLQPKGPAELPGVASWLTLRSGGMGTLKILPLVQKPSFCLIILPSRFTMFL